MSQKYLIVFNKIFDADIRNLLIMSDMWRSRAPPLPLDFDAILDGTFVLRQGISNGKADAPTVNGSGHNGSANGFKPAVNGTAPLPPSGLKDQRELTLQDNVLLFVSRYIEPSLFRRDDR